jgi:membrane associated rhomboid family serine protease
MFSDCQLGMKKLAVYAILASLPVAAMFVLVVVSAVVYRDASALAAMHGIKPRESTSENWVAVFLSWPFLHFGWSHLSGNAPFAWVLGFICCLRGVLDYVIVFVFSMWIGGLGVWLFGGPFSVHAGASGVIMGFFGALLVRVVFDRELVSFIWGAIVAVFYGSLFFVLIPSEAYSWQGHCFGFLGGNGVFFFCLLLRKCF